MRVKCRVCGSQWSSEEWTSHPGCAACQEQEGVYICSRCDAEIGAAGSDHAGERTCHSVVQFRATGRIAFEEEAHAAAAERERIEAMTRAAETERRRQEEEERRRVDLEEREHLRRLAEAERAAEDERHRREEEARRAAAESERRGRVEDEREREARKAATRRWVITGGIATLLAIIIAIVAGTARKPADTPTASTEQVNKLAQMENESKALEEENTKLRLEIERTRQLEEIARRQRDERTREELERTKGEELERIRRAEKERQANNTEDKIGTTVVSVQDASYVRLAIEAMIKSANDANDGSVEDARSKLNNIKRLARGDVDAAIKYNVHGMEAARRQDYENASSYFRKAVEADSSDSDLNGRLGYALLLSGNIRAAEPELIKSLGLSPTNYFSWLALGITHALNGNKEKAIGCFMNAIRYGENKTLLLRYLERLSLEAGNENIRSSSDSVLRKYQIWPVKRLGIVISTKPIIDTQNHTKQKQEYRLVVRDLLDRTSITADSILEVAPESKVVVVFEQEGAKRIEPFVQSKALANELFFGFNQSRNPNDNHQADNVASGIAPADPRERCAKKDNFISKALCESRTCQKPEYSKHPYCESYRQQVGNQ